MMKVDPSFGYYSTLIKPGGGDNILPIHVFLLYSANTVWDNTLSLTHKHFLILQKFCYRKIWPLADVRVQTAVSIERHPPPAYQQNTPAGPAWSGCIDLVSKDFSIAWSLALNGQLQWGSTNMTSFLKGEGPGPYHQDQPNVFKVQMGLDTTALFIHWLV